MIKLTLDSKATRLILEEGTEISVKIKNAVLNSATENYMLDFARKRSQAMVDRAMSILMGTSWNPNEQFLRQINVIAENAVNKLLSNIENKVTQIILEKIPEEKLNEMILKIVENRFDPELKKVIVHKVNEALHAGITKINETINK